jgi:hypothetical protein
MFASIAVGRALLAAALVVDPLTHPVRPSNDVRVGSPGVPPGPDAGPGPGGSVGRDVRDALAQDVLPVSTSRGLFPFPPLPAIVLPLVVGGEVEGLRRLPQNGPSMSVDPPVGRPTVTPLLLGGDAPGW